MLIFLEFRSALMILLLFVFILLILRSHIMLVIVMLLSVAQSVRIFTHWRRYFISSRVQIVLCKRSLLWILMVQETVASQR